MTDRGIAGALERLVFGPTASHYRRFVRLVVFLTAVLALANGLVAFDVVAVSATVADALYLAGAAVFALFVLSGLAQVVVLARAYDRGTREVATTAAELETTAADVAETAAELETAADEVETAADAVEAAAGEVDEAVDEVEEAVDAVEPAVADEDGLGEPPVEPEAVADSAADATTRTEEAKEQAAEVKRRAEEAKDRTEDAKAAASEAEETAAETKGDLPADGDSEGTAESADPDDAGDGGD